MLERATRLTFEIFSLFVAGTFSALFINSFLSDYYIRILFTLVLLIPAVVLFINIKFINYDPKKNLGFVIIRMMWTVVFVMPFFNLLYFSKTESISIEVILFLSLLAYFVGAYCTVFKNSSSGMLIFVEHLTKRWSVTPVFTDFLLLIYAGILICSGIILSMMLTNVVYTL